MWSILFPMTPRPTDNTVYPKKYAHGFCFAVLCCGYTLTDFPISIRLTSLALWQSNDCPSASKATLMNMDKYFMWIHYERLHNHNKAKHNKTVCIFLVIYCKTNNTTGMIQGLYCTCDGVFTGRILDIFFSVNCTSAINHWTASYLSNLTDRADRNRIMELIYMYFILKSMYGMSHYILFLFVLWL